MILPRYQCQAEALFLWGLVLEIAFRGVLLTDVSLLA
jgi:hypothetical protein